MNMTLLSEYGVKVSEIEDNVLQERQARKTIRFKLTSTDDLPADVASSSVLKQLRQVANSTSIYCGLRSSTEEELYGTALGRDGEFWTCSFEYLQVEQTLTIDDYEYSLFLAVPDF
mmetsp:Transcript_141/g.135  ORF Transcript_141/g.135 Transcript_141/m.135 type:complete len:116 (+) Transcript_141:2-349(+)